MTCSIAELLATGVILEADEAVAIAQQLITALRDVRDTDEVQPPFGPPTADNVFLRDDGTVFCRGCEATPAVSEVGIFLDSLLPEGSSRVPGGVRYTIARALLNVDVPPFGSLEELSRDLARHERADRAESVRRALSRCRSVRAPAVVSPFDRRRHHASATDLRRALRQAEIRLFEQQRQLPRDPVIDVLPAARDHTRLAAAACLVAGLVLVSGNELMHREAPSVASQSAPIAAPSVASQSAPIGAPPVAPEEPRIAPKPADASPARGIIAVHDTPASRARAAQPATRRVSLKSGSRSQAGTGRRAAARPLDPDQRKRGVLDRLRLGWLRSVL